MTEPHNDTADIAWLRTLAAESARTPYRGGSAMVSAGLIYGAASLLQWAALTGLVSRDLTANGVQWLVATVLFLATLPILIWRMKGAAGVRTTANRVVSTVWGCVGWSIFVLFACMAIRDARLGGGVDVGAFWLVPSIIMVFYALGWAVTASLYGNGRLWWLSIGSFVAAAALAALTGDAGLYLGYAVALFLLMALPGYLLMRVAKRG
ncbi:hypothetical protein [Brevundimonas sp.]|uniref:hypothetical protein n=1 Tax=Brevundimonas sp. TaxID=1871086 RepID=UPI00262685E6|nr:hypothetical protein [Brevundimonas sp.]